MRPHTQKIVDGDTDYLNFLNSYKDAIRGAMNKQGWSYHTFATKLGKNVSWIYKALNQPQTNVSIASLYDMAKALGMKWEKPRLVPKD